MTEYFSPGFQPTDYALIASNKEYFVTDAVGGVKPICLQNATNNSLMTRMFMSEWMQ